MSAAAPLTVGTAGHVDHGKTTLVQALTGKDTDRLAEEKRRGLSIELGYAELTLPTGRRTSLVDVPGHERFVRTMVAGASGIDLFLLCVAADDGVMPQTREHVAVLRALGVDRGVVALTKGDLADPARALAEVAELVPGAEAVPVSAREGAGLDQLLSALERASGAVPSRASASGPARLHVDRSFTIDGIGTVATGTLWAGRLESGEQVTLLPDGARARIRSLQVHDRAVEVAAAGQRVAVALSGIRREEVRRGDVLCAPDAELEPSFILDAVVELERDARALASGTRVQVHHGTRQAPARITVLDGDGLDPGAAGLCRLRLEAPLIPAYGDRLVLRQIAPPDTVGGGTVLEPHARKSRRGAAHLERLRALARGEQPEPQLPEAASGTARAPAAPEPPDAASSTARPAGAPRPPSEEVREAARRLAELLEADGEQPRSDGDLERAGGLNGAHARAAWRLLEAQGQAVRTGSSQHFAAAPLAALSERALEIAGREGGASIAVVRDELGTTRRHAQAILEHLDAAKLTVRHGDVHVARPSSSGR